MKIYKNQWGHWQTLFKNKLLNNEEIRYYMPVQFQKGQEPTKDSIDLNPTKWWGTCYVAQDNTTKPKLFIAEWEEIEATTMIKPNGEEVKVGEYSMNPELNIKEEELPFY